MRKSQLTLILISALLTSCGEFAYKRGAGPNDFPTAKKECEARSNDSKVVAQCLQDNGWTIQKMDDLDPFATASVNSDNRAITTTGSANATIKNPVSNSTALKNDATSSSESVNAEKTAQVTDSSAIPPADPLDKFIISSWWKMGGSADSLQTAINQCVAQLGEAHRPNPVTQEATRGLGLCMRGKGWTGLKDKK